MATFRRVACRLSTLQRSIFNPRCHLVSALNIRAACNKELQSIKSYHVSCVSRADATSVSSGLDDVENDTVTEVAVPFEKKLFINTIRYKQNEIKYEKMISEKTVRMLMSLMMKQEYISPKDILTLLSMTGKCLAELQPKERVVLTKEVWANLEEKGVELTVDHYNKLMSVYIENEYLFSPDDILGEMHKQGVSPNLKTYQLMIDSYCEAGDLVGASMIAKMRNTNLSRYDDLKIFHSIIKGCFRIKQIDEAMEMVQALRKQNYGYLYKDTYILLMRLYAEKGDVESLKQIKHEAETEAGNVFNDSALFEVIEGMRRYNQLHYVDLVMGECSNWLKGGSPHRFASLYTQLECRGQDEVALKLLNVMNKSFYINNDTTMQRLLKIPVKKKWPVEEVETLLKKFYTRDLPADLCVAVFAACTYEDLDYALEILDYMEEKGYQLKAHYFYPLICSYRARDDTDGIRNMLQRLSNTVDNSSAGMTFQILRNALDKKKKHNSLASLLQEYGIYWGNTTFKKTENVSELLDLINQGKLEEAVKYFHSIPNLKTVNRKVKEILISRCIQEQNYPLLEEVLKSLQYQRQMQYCGIDMTKTDVLEESPPSCQKILIAELEMVLRTYNKTELKLALSHARSPKMRRLIQTNLYPKTNTVKEAEEVIPDSELNNFPKTFFRHKAILYLNENKIEKAMDCVRILQEEGSGMKWCPDHRLLTNYRTLEDLNKRLTKAKVTRLLTDQTIVGQWIRCLCNSGTPEEVYPVVETLVQTYKYKPMLYRDFLLGYISRNDVAMVMDSYKIIIDTQMKTTKGSHYVLEFLNTNGHEKELAEAYDTCLNMLGPRIAEFSLFYAKAFKDISSPNLEQLQFKPHLYESNALKDLFYPTLEDRQYDQFETFLQYATSQFKTSIFTQPLLLHYNITKNFDKAFQLLTTDGVDHSSLKVQMRHLNNNLITRSRDFGFNVPKVTDQRIRQVWDMLLKIKDTKEANDTEDIIVDVSVTEELSKLKLLNQDSKS